MNKMSSKYLIILGVLSLVILISQLLIQKTIKDNGYDSRIINISGRQRMLSQKITKAALKLRNATDLSTYIEAKNELRSSLDLFESSHEALKNGDKKMDLDVINNSEEIKALFERIEPHFVKILRAGNNLFDVGFRDIERNYNDPITDQHLKDITGTEKDFLILMNEITFLYDKEASLKIEKLSRSEYYLLSFTFLLILLEALLIFRPMAKTTKEKDSEISALDEKVKLSMKELEEKTKHKEYASSQIKEANAKISELRSLVFKVRSQLQERETAHTLAISKKIEENALLADQHKESSQLVTELKKELAHQNDQLVTEKSYT